MVFADQASGIAGRFPTLPGVGGAAGHERLIAPAAMLMGILARPKGDARGHTEGMGGKGMVIAHPFRRQPRQVRRFTGRIAVEVASGRLLLVGHDDQDVWSISHGAAPAKSGDRCDHGRAAATPPARRARYIQSE